MSEFTLPRIGKPLLFAIFTFVSMSLSSAILIWKFEKNRMQEERAQVLSLSSGFANALQQNINHLMSATYAQAALVQQDKGEVKNFDAFVKQMLAYFPGGTIMLLAPDGVIQHVAPLAGNQKAIGHNLLTDPVLGKEARMAKESGELTLAGPFELIQGGQGIAGRLPIYLAQDGQERRFWGFSNVVARMSSILEWSQLAKLQQLGYHYQLSRMDPNTGTLQIIAQTPGFTMQDPVQHIINLPNGKWTLQVLPLQGWGQRLSLAIAVLLALLFSTMLAYIVKLFMESKVHERSLEMQVSQRTSELLEREEDLNRAQEVARMGSWVLEIPSGVIRCSAQTRHIFHISEHQPFNFLEILRTVHPDDRALLKQSWSETEHGNNCDIELRILQEPHIRWLRVQIEQVRDAAGVIVRRVGTVQDITEHHYNEEGLRIAAIAFEAQEGMIVTDDRNKILRVNQAFTRITGYSSAEAVGNNANMLKSGQHDASFYQGMWHSLHQNGCWQGEIWNRRKSGEVYPEWLTITAVKNKEGRTTNYVGTIIDVSQRKEAEAQIESLAFYDPVTKLPNRRLFTDRLKHALVANARSKRQGALIYLDLDNFKTLNDTVGHDKGDLLLQEVAQRLIHCVRKGDTVSRFGGDEFVLILEDISDDLHETAISAEVVATKILSDVEQTYYLNGYEHHITVSIGITLFGQQNETAENLLKQVELAMYQAKSSGGNALRFFDPNMLTVVNARASMEADLRYGLQTQQFQLYYQIQVNGHGEISGAEALVRWRHPRRGMVSPAEFIPLAEETGLILPLGLWVLETACEQLVEWALSPDTEKLTLAVNVSARQFHQPNFIEQVLNTIENCGANPCRLKLELTESLLIENVEDTITKMTVLKNHGVGFSLDDFGTGYSSLSYIKRLPLDQLKIDQSFVRDVLNDPHDATIVKTIIGLGQSLGLSVIAEGVETEAQRDFLISQGCTSFQGYLYGRPRPIVELLETETV